MDGSQLFAMDVFSRLYHSDQKKIHYLVVYGPAGTGKSFVLKQMASLASDGNVFPMAHVALQADRHKGHSIDYYLTLFRHNKNKMLSKVFPLRNRSKPLVILIDEISMVHPTNQLLKLVEIFKLYTSRVPVIVVMFGDFRQAQPIGNEIISDLDFWESVLMREACVCKLDTQFRFDAEQQKLFSCLRHGVLKSEHFQQLTSNPYVPEKHQHLLHVFWTWRQCEEHNRLLQNQLHGKDNHFSRFPVLVINTKVATSALQKTVFTRGMDKTLTRFYEDMRVMVWHNFRFNPDTPMFNGQMGSVKGYKRRIFCPCKGSDFILKFGNQDEKRRLPKCTKILVFVSALSDATFVSSSFKPHENFCLTEDGTLMIQFIPSSAKSIMIEFPITRFSKLPWCKIQKFPPGGIVKDYPVVRLDGKGNKVLFGDLFYSEKGKTKAALPLISAQAMTIHKMQGLTVEDVFVVGLERKMPPGLTYVAITRARSPQKLIIRWFGEGKEGLTLRILNEMLQPNKKFDTIEKGFAARQAATTIFMQNYQKSIAPPPRKKQKKNVMNE